MLNVHVYYRKLMVNVILIHWMKMGIWINTLPSILNNRKRVYLYLFHMQCSFIQRGFWCTKDVFFWESLSLSLSIEKKDGFILPIPPLIICIPKIHGQCITMKNYAIYLFQKKIDIPLPMKRPCPTNIEQLLCE